MWMGTLEWPGIYYKVKATISYDNYMGTVSSSNVFIIERRHRKHFTRLLFPIYIKNMI